MMVSEAGARVSELEARRGSHHLLLEDVVGVAVVRGGELGGDFAGGGPGPGGDGLRLEHVVLRAGGLLRLGSPPRRCQLRPGSRIGIMACCWLTSAWSCAISFCTSALCSCGCGAAGAVVPRPIAAWRRCMTLSTWSLSIGSVATYWRK